MPENYNNTVYYLKKRGEICNAADCGKCPLSKNNNGKKLACDRYEERFPEEAIAAVREWHESKTKKYTYLDDFFDKFPDAPKAIDGYPYIKPCSIYSEIKNNNKYACTLCSSNNCWDMKKE